MTLRKTRSGWPHDAAKLPSASLAGGPFMLRKGWPHVAAKNSERWPHVAANRQARGRTAPDERPCRSSRILIAIPIEGIALLTRGLRSPVKRHTLACRSTSRSRFVATSKVTRGHRLPDASLRLPSYAASRSRRTNPRRETCGSRDRVSPGTRGDAWHMPSCIAVWAIPVRVPAMPARYAGEPSSRPTRSSPCTRTGRTRPV